MILEISTAVREKEKRKSNLSVYESALYCVRVAIQLFAIHKTLETRDGNVEKFSSQWLNSWKLMRIKIGFLLTQESLSTFSALLFSFGIPLAVAFESVFDFVVPCTEAKYGVTLF
jgi:hypothetical protein